jgi:hypothetical protein
MKYTLTIATLLTSLIVSGQVLATQDPQTNAPNQHQLALIKNKLFDELRVGDINAAKTVSKVYIQDLSTELVSIQQPNHHRRSILKKWTLNQKDIDGFKQLYRKAFEKKFSAKAGYTIVNAPGDDVMTISAQLLELAPSAPKDDFRSRDHNVKYISSGAGTAKIEIAVIVNGAAILMVKDDRRAGYQLAKNDRFSNRREVAQMFNSWASKLFKQLNAS